jgi:hypothetical protein
LFQITGQIAPYIALSQFLPLVNTLQKSDDPIRGKFFENVYLLFDGFQENDFFTEALGQSVPF